MRVLEIVNKELFLRYAIPCGQVLVERGSLDRELLEKLNKKVADERPVRERIEDLFPVAARMCTIIANMLGKESIDSDVIRRYFLFEHERAVKWRASLFPDIRIDECLVQPGRILRKERGMLLASTPRGELLLRRELVPEGNRGDFVTVHYDFASEIIGRKEFEMLKGMRL